VQSMIPLFTGELNYIASREKNYWYLYVRKGNNITSWPRLIHSQDIPVLSKLLEEAMLSLSITTVDELVTHVQGKKPLNYKSIQEVLKYPDNTFPYYEGLNAMLTNHYWLGLYWRNNRYDIDFMNAACRLCQETYVNTISIIPWKAFVMKGIHSHDRLRWEKLMGKFGINERHSSLELNWHLPVTDMEALDLKRFLVRELDQQDISTHGLTFTIKTSRDMFLFTSIVIEKETGNTYNVLYAKNFNPNNITYERYARGVKKEAIPALLIELSKLYFRQLNPEREQSSRRRIPFFSSTPQHNYRCKNCLAIYDQKHGDPVVDIPPGVPFEELPETYECHVCGSPKRDFELVE
jgi:rubredoxin